MKILSELSQTEKRIAAACIVVALIAVSFMSGVADSVHRSVTLNKTSRPEIGTVASVVNDTRIRDRDSLVWSQTENSQHVHIGDSVFAGPQSEAKVQLKKGGDVTVGENSLVVFSEVREKALPNLAKGNFKVEVKGEAQIAIRGVVTTIKGHNSVVEVAASETGKSSLKLVRGEAQVISDSVATPIELKPEEKVELPEPPPEAISVREVVPEIPTIETASKSVVHLWTVSDLFQQKNGVWTEHDPSSTSAQSVEIRWSQSEEAQKYFVEVSARSDMRNAELKTTEKAALTLSGLSFGKTYWRVSEDQKRWSDIQSVHVEGKYFASSPHLKLSEPSLNLIDGKASLSAKLENEYPEYFVQVSRDGLFRLSEAQTSRVESLAKISFSSDGRYFVRVSAVNANDEVSSWSNAERVDVSTPQLLSAPRLEKTKFKIETGEKIELRWSKVKGAVVYEAEIRTAKGELKDSFRTERNYLEISSSEAQELSVELRAKDEWNRLGENAHASIVVSAPPAPVRELASEPAKTEETQKPDPVPAYLAKEDSPHHNGKNFWAWIGAGIAYTKVAQDSPEATNIDVSGFKKPAVVLRLGVWASENVGLDLSYSETPGEALSSPSIRMIDSKYDWQTFSGEALYQFRVSDQDTLNFRAGIQQHRAPLFVPVSATEIAILEGGVTAATAGFEYKRSVGPKATLEWLMRYQQPIASQLATGASYEAKNKFVFDGSIGGTYKINDVFRLGVFWHGQWHNYKFTYTDEINGTGFSGEQKLFHSTLDFRLGAEF